MHVTRSAFRGWPPEHIQGRWEVYDYLKEGALSVVQCDPEWCGGTSELVKICAVASLYDCYTSTVLLTLEDAGFCPKGGAAKFVEEHDLTWRGDFPLNTHGGQLSFGQADVAGGMSHVTEAVLQLQGRADGRQIAECDYAFVHGNGGIMSEQASAVLGVSR